MGSVSYLSNQLLSDPFPPSAPSSSLFMASPDGGPSSSGFPPATGGPGATPTSDRAPFLHSSSPHMQFRNRPPPPIPTPSPPSRKQSISYILNDSEPEGPPGGGPTLFPPRGNPSHSSLHGASRPAPFPPRQSGNGSGSGAGPGLQMLSSGAGPSSASSPYTASSPSASPSGSSRHTSRSSGSGGAWRHPMESPGPVPPGAPGIPAASAAAASEVLAPQESGASSAAPKRRKRRASVPCDTCGRVFGEAAALRKHQKVVHEQRKDFKCDVCGRAFAEKSNLKKHTQARHGTAANPHPCSFCGKTFNFSDGLRRHVNNCHLGLRPYVCDVEGCDAAFKQRTHLQKHKLRVNHGRPKPGSDGPS